MMNNKRRRGGSGAAGRGRAESGGRRAPSAVCVPTRPLAAPRCPGAGGRSPFAGRTMGGGGRRRRTRRRRKRRRKREAAARLPFRAPRVPPADPPRPSRAEPSPAPGAPAAAAPSFPPSLPAAPLCLPAPTGGGRGWLRRRQTKAPRCPRRLPPLGRLPASPRGPGPARPRRGRAQRRPHKAGAGGVREQEAEKPPADISPLSCRCRGAAAVPPSRGAASAPPAPQRCRVAVGRLEGRPSPRVRAGGEAGLPC